MNSVTKYFVYLIVINLSMWKGGGYLNVKTLIYSIIVVPKWIICWIFDIMYVHCNLTETAVLLMNMLTNLYHGIFISLFWHNWHQSKKNH